MSTVSIAMIGADTELFRFLKKHLDTVGYRLFFHALNESLDLGFIIEISPSMILIDISATGLEGIEICGKIRTSPSLSNMPIVLITAQGQNDIIVQWLNAGANGYIDKPISTSIFTAKIQSILRISENRMSSFSFQGLTLDVKSHSVKLNGMEVTELTRNEFRTLLLLLKHPKRVFARDQIIRELQDGERASSNRAVDVTLVHLRRKLGDWSDHIKTVRGFGYKLC